MASVSVGVSVGLSTRSLFGFVKIGASALFAHPQFPRGQKAKNASNLRKALRKHFYAGYSRLLRSALVRSIKWLYNWLKNSRHFFKPSAVNQSTVAIVSLLHVFSRFPAFFLLHVFALSSVWFMVLLEFVPIGQID